MRKSLAALAVVSCVSAAQASNWMKSGTTAGGSSYVDVDSIRQVAPGIRAAWNKSTWTDEKEAYKEIMAFTQFNCRNQTAADIQMVGYRRDGTNESFVNSLSEIKWEAVPPDTTVEGRLKLVCTYPSPK